MNSTDAKKLFDSALAQIESKSIREWATGPRNGPIFQRIAATYSSNDSSTANKFAIYIMAEAIGL